ncbi:MAG TPA: GNAT family N-acetyltransferase, partial [Terriglobales bacterium]|nr:GNAT family N-acetyltransferase [Terriglobales bacterium]
MIQSPNIETQRLVLRCWRSSDLEPFAKINADPNVMEFFPAPLTSPQSDALVAKIERHFRRHGFGLYAVDLKDPGGFVGFIGLSVPAFHAHFTPCVEIGWRLSSDTWGKGLATEGAEAVLKYSREVLRLKDVVSFTVPVNVRSRRVMEKIGMTRDPADDFDHPQLPPGHPLRRHVLYRMELESLPVGEKGGAQQGSAHILKHLAMAKNPIVNDD